MKVGLNQAVLGKIYKKSQESYYDYSQTLLPEEDRKTTFDILSTVDFRTLYSCAEDTKELYGHLVVSTELFACLELEEAYLFFFDKEKESSDSVVKNILPAKGGYDWVESLGQSENLTPEQREACKALAASEKEKKRLYEEFAAKGEYPFGF